MERIVHIAKSFEGADEWDIQQNISMSPDVQDFIELLAAYDVRYVIVGGEAVIYYGFARVTGDIDFFLNRRRRTHPNYFRCCWSSELIRNKEKVKRNKDMMDLKYLLALKKKQKRR